MTLRDDVVTLNSALCKLSDVCSSRPSGADFSWIRLPPRERTPVGESRLVRNGIVVFAEHTLPNGGNLYSETVDKWLNTVPHTQTSRLLVEAKNLVSKAVSLGLIPKETPIPLVVQPKETAPTRISGRLPRKLQTPGPEDTSMDP
ncbi:MAG: hypothetical protein UY48_C0003G0051 [Candidatus Gottesmanbacteria bacterium GW2011_GWB1_49_7]|uniref:Uncharacterized protein n=1 Tax=Candidatus Gottesmanbacteria bacterium GW2011_GWB1_49_7 TaxID=1618448 RepID=A0A0G1Z381_9BACT|nr:MAG: hypothetical protein UY48_C0003G0051 [Candidatus Gottesmanbacteria bacterium GW2011_GWB1_49_7]